MAVVANKRSVMTLYSGRKDIYSHQTRIVLAEKGINVEILDVNPNNKPEDLLDLNPYSSVPTLVDRDLVLYQAPIIMEYLDERFPHPPLMPVYPVMRAKSRLMMYRLENDWYSLLRRIDECEGQDADDARKELLDSMLSIAPVFSEMPYFLSEDFSLVDAVLAPLLWRLPSLDITLPAQAKSIRAYMDRVFERDSFQASLTEVEREMVV
jgi:RNA polymerase-associated protein